MSLIILLPILTLMQSSPATELSEVRQLLTRAPTFDGSSKETSELVEKLRQHGTTRPADLFSYIEEGGKPATVALRLLPYIGPIDATLRTRLRSLLPSLDGQSLFYATQAVLTNDQNASETAASVISHIKMEGLSAVVSWSVQAENQDITHQSLRRAKELVKTGWTNYGVFSILIGSDPDHYLGRPQFSRDLLDLALAACEYPENLSYDSFKEVYNFALTKGALIDVQRVEQQMKSLIATSPEPIPSIICWQIFVVGIEKTGLGTSLLFYAAKVHPELTGLIQQLSQAHFSKMNIYGVGEIKKITSQLDKDRSKLRQARQKLPATTQPTVP